MKTFSCADPESFAIWGVPTVTTFFVCLFFVFGFSLMRGERIQIPLFAGQPSFKWRFAGGPMMAQHGMLAW